MSVLAPGRWLHRYRVDAELGAGGMGEVYRAFDSTLQRWVALKVLRPDAGSPPSPEQRGRFLREARAAAAVRHPGLITIFDVGEADGIPYIAMELLEGRSLGDYVGSDVSLDRKVSWLVQMARALAAAHAAGFIHRDVKPSNVIVCGDDTLKLLDFGVARALDAEVLSFGPTTGASSFRTGYGAIVGTPRYMAPEQAAGLTVDARVDQFAWGIVAFELLTGRRPRDVTLGFCAEAEWQSAAPAIVSLCPQVPSALAIAIARALERADSARFPSMAALLDSLGTLVAGERTPLAPAGGAAVPAATGDPTWADPSIGTTLSAPPTLGNSGPWLPPPRALQPFPQPPARPSHAPAILIAALAVGLLLLAAGTVLVVRPSLLSDLVPTPPDSSVHPPVATPSLGAPSAIVAPPSTSPSSTSSSPAIPKGPVRPSAIDAGPVPPAAPDAGVAKHVHVQLNVVPNPDYPDSVVRPQVSATVARVEACIDLAGFDSSKPRTAGVHYSYDGSGRAISMTVQCEPQLCGCVKANFTNGLSLRPPASHLAGGIQITLFVTP